MTINNNTSKSKEKLENLIVNSLPFGVAIQDHKFTTIYENERMISLTQPNINKTCYERWSNSNNFKGKKCTDCPAFLAVEKGEPATVYRKINDGTSSERYLKITHIPIKQNNSPGKFIETIEDVSKDEVNKINLIEYKSKVSQNLKCGLINFGKMGGQMVYSENLDNLIQIDINHFYEHLSAYWYTAIGQGHNWPLGFFGPLPVLDYHKYLSFAFSIMYSKDQFTSKRDKDDLVLFIIILDKEFISSVNNHKEIDEFLYSQFQQYLSLEDITMNEFNKICENFRLFIQSN
ncbi:MAG: hypothetical protein OEY49_06050 [Candidatus Heimdallarchaeota archaeon]|nr:hypothetical protein [Candidatus Heimdallarchaeota archaeon]